MGSWIPDDKWTAELGGSIDKEFGKDKLYYSLVLYENEKKSSSCVVRNEIVKITSKGEISFNKNAHDSCYLFFPVKRRSN